MSFLTSTILDEGLELTDPTKLSYPDAVFLNTIPKREELALDIRDTPLSFLYITC